VSNERSKQIRIIAAHANIDHRTCAKYIEGRATKPIPVVWDAIRAAARALELEEILPRG
jgi:hypothetical protein